MGVDAEYGDHKTPVVETGAGGQVEPAQEEGPKPATGPVFNQVVPGVIIGRWVQDAKEMEFEQAGDWYVNSEVARGDIEKGAQKSASRTNTSQMVHAHPMERTTKKGNVKLVKCNDRCKVILPDVNWPGGSMGGRI